MIGDVSAIVVQLGIIVILAAVAAFLLRLIKQPQILAYVLVGILITPVFGLITDTSVIEAMSTIGIAFLLFIIGLEMDIQALRTVALVSSLGGMLQIITMFVLGYLAALLLGFLSLEAAYIGLIVVFSSTMIVLKLLSDKRELQTLHGRIIIGILLMEDVIAIFALSVLASVNGFSLMLLGTAIIKFLLLFAIAFLLSKYVFPPIFRIAARSQELLFILSLAVLFMFSLGFQYLGFSIAIGSFLAGISLGNLRYDLEIAGKVKSLRDFFALLFFVSLGMALSLKVVQGMWPILIVLLTLVIVVKPMVMMTICSLFRYTKKPAFLAAHSLSQMGEFSLIIAAQGLALGHISSELFSLIIIIALVTITLTSYFIQYDKWFYKSLEKPLRIFNIFHTEGMEYLPTEAKPKIVLCGYNRIGYSILSGLRQEKKEVLIVDYNPEIIDRVVKEGFHCIYGDVTDEEIMERMNLPQISMLISTVPELNDNLLLIRKVREATKKAKIIVTAADIDDALKLYMRGAHYVILPHFLGGEHVSRLITGVRHNRLDLQQQREDHIRHLHERKRIGHRHPTH